MKNILNGGLYPAMITFYDENGNIDYTATKALIDFYVKGGVAGIFAVCQSSEMFFISEEDKYELGRFVVENVPGNVDVVVSGITGETLEEMFTQIEMMKKVGAKSIILLTNRLCHEDETDEDMWAKITAILEKFPDTDFGLYECPYPYKKLLSDDILAKCSATGRFNFIKDTCCSAPVIKGRLAAINNPDFKLYNANSATLLETVYMGAAGISGVMANFHPELYSAMFRAVDAGDNERAQTLQYALSALSVIENQNYPANAKYYLQLEGLPVKSIAVKNGKPPLTEGQLREVEATHKLYSLIRKELGV